MEDGAAMFALAFEPVDLVWEGLVDEVGELEAEIGGVGGEGGNFGTEGVLVIEGVGEGEELGPEGMEEGFEGTVWE